MYRFILIFTLSFFVTNIFAQISFEKGYFIDTTGKRVECYIRNFDWLKTPTKFVYKVSMNDEKSTADVNVVKEFGVYTYSKYIVATVQIDHSKIMDLYDDPAKLSSTQDPEWVTEKLFLKVLVNGKANLYYYEDGVSVKYFYNVDNNLIEQLIYKDFSVDGLTIKTNKSFQEQLLVNVNCANTRKIVVSRMSYKKNELEKYFNAYNSCLDYSKIETKTNNNPSIRIHLIPGFTNGVYTTSYGNPQFPEKTSTSNTSFRIGAELEFVLTFSNNKWSLFIEPYYENFSVSNNNFYQPIEYHYNLLSTNFGARHYMYFKKDFGAFINLMLFTNIINNSSLKIGTQQSENVGNAFLLASGLGIRFKKFSTEFRYKFSDNYNQFTTNSYNKRNTQIDFLLGYTLFQNIRKAY